MTVCGFPCLNFHSSRTRCLRIKASLNTEGGWQAFLLALISIQLLNFEILLELKQENIFSLSLEKSLLSEFGIAL